MFHDGLCGPALVVVLATPAMAGQDAAMNRKGDKGRPAPPCRSGPGHTGKWWTGSGPPIPVFLKPVLYRHDPGQAGQGRKTRGLPG